MGHGGGGWGSLLDEESSFICAVESRHVRLVKGFADFFFFFF